MIGRQIDRYTILAEVGQGGMSIVYRGIDLLLKREVAVKVLHPHLAGHEEARRRLEREAQAVAKLKHENIPEIYDYSGLSSEHSYIVTEFVRGHTLRELVTVRRIEWPEVAALLVSELCRALGHAHSLGILHRDVKPENVMIRDDGVVKLMDFGIAQVIDTQRVTVTGQLLGSPAYMSPEHVEGRPLDVRTDIFAAGIMLFELATGELPFRGKNAHDTLRRIAECRYLDPRVVCPLIGDRLARVITRALSKDPAARHPDVAALHAELGLCLDDAGIADVQGELRAYFAGREAYDTELRGRLLVALTKRGRTVHAAGRINQALELWNRVLTIDPGHREVLGLLQRAGRRRMLVRAAVVTLVLGVCLGVAAWVRHARVGAAPDLPSHEAASRLPPIGIALASDSGTPLALPDAALPDAHPSASLHDARLAPPHDAALRGADPIRRRPTDAGVASPLFVGPPRAFRVIPGRVKSFTVTVDSGAPERVGGAGRTVLLPPGDHLLQFASDCCDTVERRVGAAEAAGDVRVDLKFRAATIVPRCPVARSITVAGSTVPSGRPVEIAALDADGRAEVAVVFAKPGGAEQKQVIVYAGRRLEVACD